MRKEHVKQIIRKNFPEFAIDTLKPLEAGQYNDVFVVNGEWIFRFPKFPSGVEQLALEIILLEGIAPHLTLPVPQPEMNHIRPGRPGETFCGYRRLRGDPFWPRTRRALPVRTARQTALQLGHFLHQLHHLPITDLVDVKMPVCDTLEEWEDIFNRVQMKLFPLMRLEACKSVAGHFEYFLHQQSPMTYEPQLRHGDFGSSNLLFDPLRQEICGILDFSFTTLGDPAVDFAGLMMYGEEYVRQMTAVYPQIDDLWPRIRFYKGSFPLLEALYGVEHNDPQAVEAGLAAYI